MAPRDDCVDLGSQKIDDWDGCDDPEGPCAECECEAGCCPLWLKMCNLVRPAYAARQDMPTGNLKCWRFYDVPCTVVQAEIIDDGFGSDIVFYRGEFPSHTQEGEVVAWVEVTCPPTATSTTLSSESNNSNGPCTIPLPGGCGSSQQCSPVWLLCAKDRAGAQFGHLSHLVHNHVNNLYAPVAGVEPNCDCANIDAINNGCNPDYYPAIKTTFQGSGGDYTFTGMTVQHDSLGCRLQTECEAIDPRQGFGDRIPVGTQMFPGWSRALDRCPPLANSRYTQVYIYSNYTCNGNVVAIVGQTDHTGCNSFVTGCGFPDQNFPCVNQITQGGSFNSAGGQTLPFTGQIPCTKVVRWVNQAPGIPPTIIERTFDLPPVTFTMDWLP